MPAPAEHANAPFSFDRPLMLLVARGERLAATRRFETTAASDDVSDEDEHADEELDPEITRFVTVRKRGLATVEDLAGYLVRTMDHTPNGLHPTRALAQVNGFVRTCEDDAEQRREARRVARSAVVFARRELKECYAQRLVRDPRIIIKQPVGLVYEQAYRLDIEAVGVDVDLRVADGHATFVGVHANEAVLYEEDVDCIANALGGAGDPDAPGIDAQVPLLLWTQPTDDTSDAIMLSLSAAVFGWLELERDAGEEALQLFEDAAWLYRIPEYQALLGLAHERLGHPRAAARAYQAYLDGRPGAPDAEVFEARLRGL